MSRDWTEDEPLDKAAEMAARTVRAAGQAKQAAEAIQAAHLATGVAKSGAAVSGTAAGTALGGPLGAVIGAVLTSKSFWKASGAVLAAVLLFLYMIVNSIGIIFSYLGFADADSYVSQAREAEYQNIKLQIETLFSESPELKAELCAVIEGYRDQMLGEISVDFSENWDGYDDYEVEDEYESRLEPMLSQYLAVLIEESWNGSRIVGFNGYGTASGFDSDLTSPYDEYFALAAATYQVPEALLKAMGKAESDFNPNAVSSAGAMGIMQLMPGTAANLGVTSPFDPKQNIMGGAKYIAELLRTFGSYPDGVRLAVAAYNAGPGAVKRAGYRIPQNGETPAYVEKVMGYLTAAGGGETVPEPGEGTEGGTSVPQIGTAVSAILLKAMVEENAKDFLGWTQTGTHTETIDGGDGEEDEEIEIVDYAIVVKLNPNLTPTGTGYSYSYVTSQTTFNYVLKLFELLKDGTDGILDLLFKATSWKNYVLGAGASEDIYTSGIQTGGDTISYDTVKGCVKEVVYFNQGEEPWASLPYGSSTIKSAGCGPTALAIIISTLTGENVTPQMTAEYAMFHGLYVSGKGTSHSFPAMAAGHWGLSVERVKRGQMDYVVKQLKEGRLALIICAENTISGSSGHFIVLTGVTEDGYIAIADPGSRSRTGKLYSPATIQSYARDLSDGGIWIMGGQ